MQRRRVVIDRSTWTIYDVVPAVPTTTRTFDPGLRTGWLCFDHGFERRRVSPIPDGWHELADEALVALWASAGWSHTFML